MGTAAVLGIYAAGYTRTEAAARQMEEELAVRRLAAAPPAEAQASYSPLAPAAEAPPVTSGMPSREPEAGAVASRPESIPALPSARGGASGEQSPRASRPASDAPIPAADSAVTAPGVSLEPPTPQSPYKDGVYTSSGWETRHGHVDVSVEIAEGRIASASVLYCGMRWPCSEVSSLIARVPELQTSEVGIVSGATQTSEAFTSAVANALALARAARTPPTTQ